MRGTAYQVHLEDFVTKKEFHTGVTCPYCRDDSKLFTSQQYYIQTSWQQNYSKYENQDWFTKRKEDNTSISIGEKEDFILNLMKKIDFLWKLLEKQVVIYILFQAKYP